LLREEAVRLDLWLCEVDNAATDKQVKAVFAKYGA
jgi:hypothetical protein